MKIYLDPTGVCVCQDGFTPSLDGTFCVDLDECSQNGYVEMANVSTSMVHLSVSVILVIDWGPDSKVCVGK